MSSLRVISTLAVTATLPVFAFDPFPNPISRSPFVVDVETFALIPNSDGAVARVNQLLTSPDGRLFAMDQRGPVYSISADGSVVTPYFNLTSFSTNLIKTREQGFQSMAFHPDFNNVGMAGFGKFYTAHSSSDKSVTPDFSVTSTTATPAPTGAAASHHSLILEWTTNTPSADTFTAANAANPFREVMRIEQPYTNHNLGLVSFNSGSTSGTNDYGNLYIGIGDGGSGGDPLGVGQNTNQILGSIARINPLQSGMAAYTVPADNPFVGGAGLDEIWAYGFRNPQRFSWDSRGGGTNTMFIADIGQNSIEEIDVGVSGGNYGWNTREGSFEYPGAEPNGTPASGGGLVNPIAEYDHSEGNAVTSGYVVRESNGSPLEGQYVFGDLANGRIFYIDAGNLPTGGQDPLTELRLASNGIEKSFLEIIREVSPGATRADLRFGQGADGTIYLINKQDGVIRRLNLVPEPGSAVVLVLVGLAELARRRRN